MWALLLAVAAWALGALHGATLLAPACEPINCACEILCYH